MSKKFDRKKADDAQRAIKRKFDNFSAVEIKKDGEFIRVISKEPKQNRFAMEANFREVDENGEKLTQLSFSSELPVRVLGEDEVLLHGGGNADFSRLMNVGAILKNHDPNQIVGVPVKTWIDDKRRGVLAMRWGTTEGALESKKEALEDKTLRGVSVGYSVKEWIYLRDNTESYQDVVGPAWVATKWDALEASLTPVPADPSVGLERMVREVQAKKQKQQEIREMNKKLKLLRAWKASDGNSFDAGAVLEVDERTFAELTEGEEPLAAKVEDENRSIKAVEQKEQRKEPELEKVDFVEEAREAARAEMRAEAKRCAEIRTVCKRSGMPELADELIAEGKTIEESQRAVLDKMVEKQKENPPPTSVERVFDGADSYRSAAIDGLLLRAGQVEIEKPADGANEFQGMSLLRLAEDCLRRANIKIPSDKRKLVDLALRGSEVISGSTSDFPYILENTANKSLLAGYGVAEVTYPYWSYSGSLNDFKSTSRVKFGEVGELKLVAENGKYTETAVTESRETIQLGTYGRVWTMSRQGIINDDLDAFTRILFSMGMQAGQLPNDLGIAVLNDNAAMTDAEDLFSAAHNNTGSDSDRALDSLAHAVAALRYMRSLMAKQTSLQHDTETAGARYLNLKPKVWLVNADGEYYARQVVSSSTDASQENSQVDNPFKNMGLTVVSDQNIQVAGDEKHFLFADPRLAPVVEIAFLQGNKQPYMEEKNQTDRDGRKWLIRLDCGAAAVDYVGAVRESGA